MIEYRKYATDIWNTNYFRKKCRYNILEVFVIRKHPNHQGGHTDDVDHEEGPGTWEESL